MKKHILTLMAILAAGLMWSQVAWAQHSVSGKVTEVTGEPIPGVLVFQQGSSNSATTDVNGAYSISCPSDAILVFSMLGYEEQKAKIGERKRIDIIMETDISTKLDEAVVIGYGSVRKADLTGSVANVKMGDIRSIPVSSVDQALQGRIAGAEILSTSGEPGATTSIRIRGTRSITASNEPLFVVDGVMDAIHDLNDLNSSDIESITVLKDASSTAIYGSRGSNGVILITTCSGENSNGKPNITFKGDAGFSQLPSGLDLMNATEYAMYRNEMAMFSSDARYENMGVNSSVADLPYKDPYSLGEGNDWIKAITRTARYQNYNVSMRGSSGRIRYYAALGFNETQGIIKNSGQEKTSARLNIDWDLFKWMTIGYKMSYTYRHNDENLAAIGGTAWYNAAMYLSPTIKINENYNPEYNGGQTINTPVATIANNTYFTNRHSQNHTAYVDLKFLPSLKFRSLFTYYLYERHQYRYYPSTLPRKGEGEGGDAYRGDFNENTYNSENTLTFDKTWRKTHHMDAVVGYTFNAYKGEGFSLSGSGYLNDQVKWNNMNAVLDKETYSASTSLTKTTKMSALARINYNYKQRYYLTVTGRADGASNFAANKKWGFFPSGAFKWNIANEKWMKTAENYVDELSLRLSAGRSGNDAISAYRSLGIYSSTTSGYLFGGSQPVAFYPSRIDSPNLTWEKTDSYNLALDASFFGGRLSFTGELYYSKTTDLLLTVQAAQQSGYSSRYANIGSTSNKGWELSVESRNIVRDKFTWSTNLTFSHNDQIVDEIGSKDFVVAYSSPGNNPYMMYGYVKGYPLNSLWGFTYAGVWHNQEEIDRNQITHTYASQSQALSQKLGAPRYVDVNHDGTLNQSDLCYLGNADPALYGGIQNSFRIGNFNFSFFFNYSIGGKIYNISELYMSGSYYTNQYRYMLNSWHPVKNPDSDIPMAGIVDVHVPSSFMVHDASYLRLKNVSLGYTFKFKSKFIQDLTLSASGENLYLWKKYNGFDPDVSSEGSSSTLRRVDNGAYPKARTVIFSVSLRY